MTRFLSGSIIIWLGAARLLLDHLAQRVRHARTRREDQDDLPLVLHGAGENVVERVATGEFKAAIFDEVGEALLPTRELVEVTDHPASEMFSLHALPGRSLVPKMIPARLHAPIVSRAMLAGLVLMALSTAPAALAADDACDRRHAYGKLQDRMTAAKLLLHAEATELATSGVDPNSGVMLVIAAKYDASLAITEANRVITDLIADLDKACRAGTVAKAARNGKRGR